MTSTRTVDELRDEMSSRVAGLVASPQTAARVVALDGARRRRRRIAGVAVLATAVAAIAIPLVIARDDNATTGPSDDGPTVPAGWTPELPGLDLPEGAALSVPYRSGADLVIDGRVVGTPADVSSLLTVPDGVVVVEGATPSSDTFTFGTSLVLIRPDGSVEQLDTGYIAGAVAARLEDGAVVVVYGWVADPDDVSGEIRVVELGGEEIQTYPVDPAMGVDVDFQPELAQGIVILRQVSGVDGVGSLLELELATGRMLAPFGLDGNSLGTTPNGIQVRFDVDRQCVVAETGAGAEAWSLCDDLDMWIKKMSPDGRVLFTATAAYDAETGEKLAAFPLPGMGNPMTDGAGLRQLLLGWEDDQTIVYGIGVETDNPDPDSPIGSVTAPEFYVGVRCSVDDGCDRIPHPIDLIGQYAR